jgi:hypothetical protein
VRRDATIVAELNCREPDMHSDQAHHQAAAVRMHRFIYGAAVCLLAPQTFRLIQSPVTTLLDHPETFWIVVCALVGLMLALSPWRRIWRFLVACDVGFLSSAGWFAVEHYF